MPAPIGVGEYDQAMPVIGVGEIELEYERSGAGPPLFLIQGMSGTLWHWGEPFLEPLRREFEVIVYNHRGVGASSVLEGGVTTAQMAEDGAGLLAALGIDSAHVLGISMGGMVAQELALARPELVHTLTLGCTYCGGEGSTLAAPEVQQRLAQAMLSGDRALALRTAFDVNVSPKMAADADAYASFLEIAQQHAVAIPVVMAQAQACAAHDTSARLSQLAMPTLVMHGTEDEMIPVQNGRLIASLIAGSELEIFDGVGHVFFWEEPERSAQLVQAHAALGV
jgi:pimeloyl-ACP methyl ester carboxylesterase